MVKNPYANAGDLRDEGSIPELGRSPREGNGNPLQYSCLEKSHGPRSLAGYSPWGLQKRVRHDLGTKQQKFFDERSCPMHCKISSKKKKKKDIKQHHWAIPVRCQQCQNGPRHCLKSPE